MNLSSCNRGGNCEIIKSCRAVAHRFSAVPPQHRAHTASRQFMSQPFVSNTGYNSASLELQSSRKNNEVENQDLHMDVDRQGQADVEDESAGLLRKIVPVDIPNNQTASWQLTVGLCAVAVLICYADRSNISTAIIEMAPAFSWDEAEKGVVLGAFFWGYMLTQLLGGHVSDRVGGQHVLTLGVTLWSLCTFITPYAADAGTATLIVARVALGLGEGVAFPAIHAIISRTVPSSSQSTSVAVVTAASYAGTALAFLVAPAIIQHASWEWTFYSFGLSALLWLPFWISQKLPNQPVAKSSPTAFAVERGPPSGRSSCSGDGDVNIEVPTDRQVRQRFNAGADAEADRGGADFEPMLLVRHKEVGFWPLMRTREVWAICIAQYTGSWGLYGLLNWLPTFFQQYYHVEMKDLGGYTFVPYIVQGLVGASSGIVADQLLSRGYRVVSVRRGLQVAGMLGPALCLVLAASPVTHGSAGAASVLVTVGLGFSALTLGAVSVSHLDIAPKHAGVIFAAGNTAATFAGLLSVPLTGTLLQVTDSWLVVFSVTALHYVVGAIMWSLWLGDKPLPQDG